MIRNIEYKFRPSLSTVGIDMRNKKIELENGKKVNVRFYDTSGQERYHSLSLILLKG